MSERYTQQGLFAEPAPIVSGVIESVHLAPVVSSAQRSTYDPNARRVAQTQNAGGGIAAHLAGNLEYPPAIDKPVSDVVYKGGQIAKDRLELAVNPVNVDSWHSPTRQEVQRGMTHDQIDAQYQINHEGAQAARAALQPTERTIGS